MGFRLRPFNNTFFLGVVKRLSQLLDRKEAILPQTDRGHRMSLEVSCPGIAPLLPPEYDAALLLETCSGQADTMPFVCAKTHYLHNNPC